MSNYLIFGSFRSADYDTLAVLGYDTYDIPGHRYTLTTVPGRNGQAMSDDGTYDPVKVVYHCSIKSDADVDAVISDIAGKVLTTSAWASLKDSWHKGVERLALPSGGIRVDPVGVTKDGAYTNANFDLSFKVRPEKYLTEGATAVAVASGSSLPKNPTAFASFPVVSITGTGTVTLSGDKGTRATIVVASGYPYSAVNVDCETMDATYSTHAVNKYLTLPLKNIQIKPGEKVTVTFSGPSKVSIRPKWWRL